MVLVCRSVLLYHSEGRREEAFRVLLRPHIPEVRVHRSKVTENVNLSVCTLVCALVFSLCGFCI